MNLGAGNLKKYLGAVNYHHKLTVVGFLRASLRRMEQHIFKYEFHISKVLKFIEIY